MFESAEIPHKIPADQYKAEVPELREALLDCQLEMMEQKKFSTIILINGMEMAGKGDTVNRLLEWLDPRLVRAYAFDVATEEEERFPPPWRYWRVMPPRGRMAIYFRSWYTEPFKRYLRGEFGWAELDQAVEEIVLTERMLAQEGVVILKFWLHLTKEQQKRAIKRTEADPRNSWRVTDEDRESYKMYAKVREMAQHALRITDRAEAPWQVIPAADHRYRDLAVGRTVLTAIRQRLTEPPPVMPPPATRPIEPIDGRRLLDDIDLSKTIDRGDYSKRLQELQARLNGLSRDPKFRQRGAVIVFEGSDAGGKGGAIRRMTRVLDARYYRVAQIAAPNEEELRRPYLWRFWRRVPARGMIRIFDRSWYGRVLVERIEGFAAEADWLRAYSEINQFEGQLARHGIVVIKFWLAISKDEQEQRFKAREETGYKRHKLTDEDWRNREKWDDYILAASEMIERTTTRHGPWTIVEAEDKRYARVKVLETVCDRIESAL